MSLLADRLGHTQLACPVRFEAGWEQRASLRLREGDKTALETYDEHGRITGGDQAQVFEDARRAYIAARLVGEDVLLMAYTREDCRELSRIIRDDLIHLGLVDSGRSVSLAGGTRASAGDLIVARENDHRLVTDPVHTLANGDILRVEAVTDQGLLVRRVIEAGEAGQRLADAAVLYPAARLATTDLGYAVTGHTGMGGTVQHGEAVFRGGEPLEWTYVALTRGRERNVARVITEPSAADPAPGDRRGSGAGPPRAAVAGTGWPANPSRPDPGRIGGSRSPSSSTAWTGRRQRTRRPNTSARAWSGPTTSPCCTPAGPTTSGSPTTSATAAWCRTLFRRSGAASSAPRPPGCTGP
jgi:hypothetical protein